MTKLAIPSIWTAWAMSAALLLRLWSAWDRLPQRVAVHFGMSLQPSGWSSRNSLLIIVITVAAGQAALATWLILRVGGAIAFIVPMQLLISFTLVSAFWQVISYNADGKLFNPLWVIGPLVLLFGAITVFMLGMLFRLYRR